MNRFPALREVALDVRDRRAADLADYFAPACSDHAPATRGTGRRLTTEDLLDVAARDRAYAHTTALGGYDPNVVEWLGLHGVPISPAGTVLLLKGVDCYYRSPNGADYLPGHRVVDPDWGRRPGAGLYLCANRRDVAAFALRSMASYRVVVVEVAVSALGLYQRDPRKICAREVHVHREVPA